jgi:hypothetical protein
MDLHQLTQHLLEAGTEHRHIDLILQQLVKDEEALGLDESVVRVLEHQIDNCLTERSLLEEKLVLIEEEERVAVRVVEDDESGDGLNGAGAEELM